MKNLHMGEMDSLSVISHPNLAKVVQMIDNQFFLYIVFEFLELGNLKDHMLKVQGYTQSQIIIMIR